MLKNRKKIEILDLEKETVYEKTYFGKHRVSFIMLFIFLFFTFIFSLKTTSLGKSITSFSKKLFDGTYTQVIPSVEIESNDYSSNTPGSWHIDKSAKWTGPNTARVTFNLNTTRKLKATQKYQDIILVMDVSGSMNGDKLTRAVNDAKDLVDSVLSDSHNQVALITFHSTSSIVSPFTNNKQEMLQRLDNLTTTGCTNYYRGLMNVDTVMENYQEQSNRKLITLFLTDGYPNEETPNQIGAYALLKDKYPYMTINGIQYEMGIDIIKEIEEISDNQFIANQDTLNNVLFKATVTPFYYEEFVITDYVHNDYFTISSIDDIKVDKGEVSLTEENGVPKITWNLENNATGFSAKMEINLVLKEQYVGQDGFYPTNKKEDIVYKIEAEQERVVNSSLTPVLKNIYQVHYDTNTPEGCSIQNPNSETYAVYQNVTIRQESLSCGGWNFKGWKIQDSDDVDVIHINNDMFKMPGHDVVIRGTWTKHEIEKSMDGEVHENVDDFLKIQTSSTSDIFGKSINRDKFESITTLDGIYIPNDAIESWDVSEQQNGSIMAWYTDRDSDEKYELYIGQDGGVKANPNSSYVFYYFQYLDSIDLTHFNTSNVTNMRSMFYRTGYSSPVFTLDLGDNFDTSNVTNMYYMFDSTGYNSTVFTLDLGDNFDTSNVTNMAGIFYSTGYSSTALTLNLGDKFDTSNVIEMQNMFYQTGYSNPNFTLDLEDNFDTSNVTNMKSMFYRTGRNSTVFTLDLGDKFDTSNVTNMSQMFDSTGYSSPVFTLDLGDEFDTSNVINMSGMFSDAGRSSTVFTLDLGDKFDTSNVTNMAAMFSYTGYSNPNFTLDLEDKFNTSNVTNMQFMFERTGYYSLVFTLDLGDKFDTSKVTNMAYMFAFVGTNNTAFTLNLGDKFNTSNVTTMYDMFHATGFSSTVFTLDLGDKFDTSKVTNMQNLFQGIGYSNTTFTMDLGDKFDTSKVTNMSQMFKSVGYSSTVFTLDLSRYNFDTSKVTNMSGMFDSTGYSNTAFTLDLGDKFDTLKVTNMKEMFSRTGYSNTAFTLDLGNKFVFTNVTNYSGIFNSWRTTNDLYVKSTTEQNWIITNSGNSKLTTANVLIRPTS